MLGCIQDARQTPIASSQTVLGVEGVCPAGASCYDLDQLLQMAPVQEGEGKRDPSEHYHDVWDEIGVGAEQPPPVGAASTGSDESEESAASVSAWRPVEGADDLVDCHSTCKQRMLEGCTASGRGGRQEVRSSAEGRICPGGPLVATSDVFMAYSRFHYGDIDFIGVDELGPVPARPTGHSPGAASGPTTSEDGVGTKPTPAASARGAAGNSADAGAPPSRQQQGATAAWAQQTPSEPQTAGASAAPQQQQRAPPSRGQRGACAAASRSSDSRKPGGPCDHCGAVESPQWRRGPPSKPVLCNACGTRYRRTSQLGPPVPSYMRAGARAKRRCAAAAAAGDSGRAKKLAATPLLQVEA